MYSNCLVEAIKAKIKDPKAVRIIYLPKKWNNGARHFMWIKGVESYAWLTMIVGRFQDTNKSKIKGNLKGSLFYF